ncbi:MAG TPA: DUF4132 domain-containing protein [Phycisphaerae bacterium]|nr:DUF4132 domain-containing protein [Phycisphaerales bacterium]HRX84993.1 DUF4132 domain-containing protein [Phycisphaerae bacterium]
MSIRDIFPRLFRGGDEAADGAAGARREAARLLARYLEAHHDKADHWFSPTTKNFPITEELSAAASEVHVQVLLAAARRLAGVSDNHPRSLPLKAIFNHLARRNLPFEPEHLTELIEIAVRTPVYNITPTPLISRVETYASAHALPQALQRALRQLLTKIIQRSADAADRRLAARIQALFGEDHRPLLDSHDVWAACALDELAAMDADASAPWKALLHHCANATQARPTRKWRKAATERIVPIGLDAFHARVNAWMERVGEPGTRPRPGGWEVFHPLLLGERNADILRGLIWCYDDEAGAPHARAIGDLADRCFKKIPGIGSLSTKIGNACLYALGAMPAPHGVAELSRLRSRAKLPSIRRMIDKALRAAAQAAGVDESELEEMSTPTFDLGIDGVRREQLGDYTAELAVESTTTRLTWRKADGKTVKSVPKAVKDNHADALKALKKAAKDMQKMLPAVRYRLESAPLSQREWTLKSWRERIFDHPLVAPMARRLIWTFAHDGCDVPAAWDGDGLVTARDEFVTPAAETRVRLWHPIDASVEQVGAWREWLVRHEITQPFKQAHREVYLLTPAELETETYSNRFAAHILRQFQLNALAQQRGWRTGVYGAFDSQNTPTLELPRWELKAEFWIEPVDAGANVLSDTGLMLYVASDQVRICRENGDPVELAQVPRIVLSEVMRDVDLFVGVSSIGNDPNWADRGERLHDNYWQSYSFGELSQTAATRRDVLTRLLPRLKIADVCTLTDRFVVVRGRLRTYKIHLGSGNILMKPNDQYLCIVPERAATDPERVYLPFEGDSTLAIILSKAFLLAADDEIKDPTIIAQIKRP